MKTLFGLIKSKRLVKFAVGALESPLEAYDYGNVFEQHENVLKISASKDQIQLLLQLIEGLEPPFYVLYVLVVSRTEKELGRYQSPLFESKSELVDFLMAYKNYFETDGRHHLWIGSVKNNDLFVYDQHNVIFSYGNIEQCRNRLIKNNYVEKAFVFPAPHVHCYHEQNDKYEEKLLSAFEWQLFPLQKQDIYDD